jgi:hypothetical protein
MPQGLVPLAIPARPVNPSGLQEQINLGAGSLVAVGNPGGPIVFANFGQMIVPALFGGIPRSVVGGH